MGEGKVEELIGRYKKTKKSRLSQLWIKLAQGLFGTSIHLSHPVPAVHVIYSHNQREQQPIKIRRKQKGGGYRDHGYTIVDLGSIKNI